MTREEAIWILDPETPGESISGIEYYGGFSGRTAAVQAVSDACILAVEALREQEERRWIPVTERLPEENEYVMIWCGECQIAKIEKGISEEQRNAMKRGELDDPREICWTSSSGYFQLKRSESYRACDEGWNNKVPYCWRVNGGMMTLFGQNVTHWMPLPEPPKEDK